MEGKGYRRGQSEDRVLESYEYGYAGASSRR